MSWAAKKWIAEGFAQGREEGRLEGRLEGQLEGRLEGLQQGMVPLLHLLVEARWPQEALALNHAIDLLPPAQLLAWIPRFQGAVDPAQVLLELRAARP